MTRELGNLTIYAAVQNGVILDTFDTYQEAYDRCQDEIKNDWLTIMFTKKLRKIFKKSGNVPMHHYAVFNISKVEEVK